MGMAQEKAAVDRRRDHVVLLVKAGDGAGYHPVAAARLEDLPENLRRQIVGKVAVALAPLNEGSGNLHALDSSGLVLAVNKLSGNNTFDVEYGTLRSNGCHQTPYADVQVSAYLLHGYGVICHHRFVNLSAHIFCFEEKSRANY